jgi:hypothetical protein
MPEIATSATRRRWWHPRFSIAALMVVVACVALGFAWIATQSRRVATIDLGPPDRIAIGDSPHTLASLQGYIRSTGVEEAFVRCPPNMPHASVLLIVQAIQGAGVERIHLRNASGPPNLALRRPQPAPADSAAAGPALGRQSR